MRKHFIYKHPIKTQNKKLKGVFYKESVYYFWFEFLKRNEEYKAYCETKEGTEEIAKLYTDFGDLNDYEFMEWFAEIGADLFCERQDLERVEEITSSEMLNTESEYVLNLQIPLNKRTKWLQQQIEKKLKAARKKFDKRKKDERRKDANKSTAKYSLCTKRASVKELERYLVVYDYVQENPKAKSAEIAYVLNIRLTKKGGKKNRLENSTTWEAQRQMIYRMKKTAKQIVANTARGEFPKHTVR